MESVLSGPVSTALPPFNKRPAISSLVEIAGRLIFFASETASLSGLEDLLAAYYCKPVSPTTSRAPDATIRFQIEDFSHEPGPGFTRFEIDGGGTGYTDGQTCVLDFATARVMARPGVPPQVDVLMRQDLALRGGDGLQALNHAISSALRRCGLYEFHSGAVVEPERNCGVLFAGPSGSGKSTLTLQLAVNGWQYLGDDVLLLEKMGEVVQACGLRRAFAVTKSTVEAGGERLREALEHKIESNGDKHSFMPEEIFPQTFLANCEPRAIFFPAIWDNDQSEARSLTASETMTRLIKLCPWACYDPVSGAAHLGALGLLAKQSKGFLLMAGRDVLRDPAHIARLVQHQLDSAAL